MQLQASHAYVKHVPGQDCKQAYADTSPSHCHPPQPGNPYRRRARVSVRLGWVRALAQMSGPCIIELRSLCLLLIPGPPFSTLQQQRRGGRGHLPWLPNPMEQAAAPGGRGLPCSQKQALALYQHLFRCPAGLGPLQAALQQVREVGHCLQRARWRPDAILSPQVQESQACPSGLELPAVLLEMERSRRAQEQVGAGRGAWQRAVWAPLHALAMRLFVAPVGLGAADWGGAGPLLAPPGPVLRSEGPGPVCMEPAQQAPR